MIRTKPFSDQVSQNSRPAAERKAETLSRAELDRDPCRRARHAEEPKEDHWRLITDLPVGSRADAIEKLEWYALRWKIEMFHKILKSGCKAEESKLRTAQRLANLVSVFCILSWRIFWMTMLNRSAPGAAPALALTKNEVDLLDHLARDRKEEPPEKSLSSYLVKIATAWPEPRPTALVDLPKFNGDQLIPEKTGGDISVQACADDPQVAFHAIRQLTRLAKKQQRYAGRPDLPPAMAKKHPQPARL